MRNCFFGAILILIIGCSESKIDPSNNQLGLEYFPLETGQFRIYDAQEILFTVLGSDTTNFQLKESVVDSFTNVENSFTYIIHRETRLNETEVWQLDSVWTARRTANFAIMVENNRSIVKLVFPIEHGTQWDGNELNGLNEKLFTYDLNIADTTLSENQFSNLSKVIQSDIPENIVNRDERYEIYAENVGLIIKNSINLEFCQSKPDETPCPATKSIESGRIFIATLTSYGKE